MHSSVRASLELILEIFGAYGTPQLAWPKRDNTTSNSKVCAFRDAWLFLVDFKNRDELPPHSVVFSAEFDARGTEDNTDIDVKIMRREEAEELLLIQSSRYFSNYNSISRATPPSRTWRAELFNMCFRNFLVVQ